MKPGMTFIFGTLIAAMATPSWAKPTQKSHRQTVKPAIVLDDLHRLTTAAYHDYIAQLSDKFAPTTVDPSLDGKPFHFVVAFSDGDVRGGLGGSPFYSYENGRLLLTLSGEETNEGRHLIVVGRKHVLNASSYIGQNAFGARARVTSRMTLTHGVAIIDGPLGEKDSYLGWSSTNNFDYWYRANLAGPDAKLLAIDADLVIDGRFMTLDNGKLADCQTLASDATMDSPTEFTDVKCFVGAKVSRVAFVHRSTGEIIKEWANAAPNPSPH